MQVIICVNYNNDYETTCFIQQLLERDYFYNGHIILVNNGISVNKILADLCSSNQQRIHFYQAEKNLGYFGGAWWGLNQYLSKFSMPEWIILSNTDIHFPDLDFFQKIAHYKAKTLPAIIAPEIVFQSSDGWLLVKQNPHFTKRPSKYRMLFYKYINRFFLLGMAYNFLSNIKNYTGIKNLIVNKLIKLKATTEKKQKVIYAPHGAFIIFNRLYFDSGGTLKHGCLLFGEEISVAETAYILKLPVLYDSSLCVIHTGGGTTSLIPSPEYIKYKNESAQYCYDLLYKRNTSL